MRLVSTKEGLSDDQRRTLLRSFEGSDSIDSLTTHWFYSIGCHPWSLAHPVAANWRIVVEDGIDWYHYIRAKAGTVPDPVCRIPIDPAIRPWCETFLEEEGEHSEREYLRRVQRFAKGIGLEGMSPRTLRHDKIMVTGPLVGWDPNLMRAMFGTDYGTLVRYAAKDRLRAFGARLVAGRFG